MRLSCVLVHESPSLYAAKKAAHRRESARDPGSSSLDEYHAPAGGATVVSRWAEYARSGVSSEREPHPL
jgi:hypothetical protein